MDTNAILSVAFSIISNFTSIVHLPPELVPETTTHLAACSIGRPYFPADIYLRHNRGSEFWIRNGAVKIYYAPNSYFGLQNPNLISNFVGTAKLSSNEVFELATSAVQRLIKSGNPLTNITPVVKAAKPYRGQPVPSYEIRWPLPENPQVFTVARVGIDARDGQIVLLSLHDPGFGDEFHFQQLSNLVFADADFYGTHVRQISNLVHGKGVPLAITNSRLFQPKAK